MNTALFVLYGLGCALTGCGIGAIVFYARGWSACELMWETEWDLRQGEALDRDTWADNLADPTAVISKIRAEEWPLPVSPRMTDTVVHDFGHVYRATAKVTVQQVVQPIRTEIRVPSPTSPWRHRIDLVAKTPLTYIPRHGLEASETTNMFARIVNETWTPEEAAQLMRWCSWCESGEHKDCPGCSCPCGLGVEAYAIGSRHG